MERFSNLCRFFPRTFVATVLLAWVTGIILISLKPIALQSFDLSYLFTSADSSEGNPSFDDVVLVYADALSVERLGGSNNLIRRDTQIALLERFTEDESRLVFLDFSFRNADPDSPVDQALSKAMRENGAVVLAAPVMTSHDSTSQISKLLAPSRIFREASIAWGHTVFPKGVVRRIPQEVNKWPSAIWEAYSFLYPDSTIEKMSDTQQWINYYSPDSWLSLNSYRLEHALSYEHCPTGLFKDKIIFVGQRYPASFIGEAKDSFRTPYSRFGYAEMAGVELLTTAFLNLARGQELTQFPLFWEVLMVIIWGALIAVIAHYLSIKRPIWTIVIIISSGLLMGIGLVLVQTFYGYWSSWLTFAIGQPAVVIVCLKLYPRQAAYDAFISYRKKYDGDLARLLQKDLKSFGLNTYIDVQDMRAGEFHEQLLGVIDQAEFFVLLLSEHTLDRCLEKKDVLYSEITHAINKKEGRIILVFVDGFSFASIDNEILALENIGKLPNYHGESRTQDDHEGFVRRLKGLIKGRRSDYG